MNIEKILRLNQEELLSYNYIELIKRGYKNKEIILTDDYLYAKGNLPILLVAHCDIVHTKVPELIVNDRKQRILWSPTGIGGDDRCGVYAILKLCEKFKPYVLFTTDEEVGGLGVKKFVKEIAELPVNFIIEIDRKGNEEVVFYKCDNKEFQNYIISFGFNKNYGSYSDVSTLSVEYDIAGCNVSAGYYNQHTTTEHIYMNHLENTINKVAAILNDKAHHKFYDCQKVQYTYTGTGGKYSDYYDEDWYDDWKTKYKWDYKNNCWQEKLDLEEKTTKEIEEPKEIEEVEEKIQGDIEEDDIENLKMTQEEIELLYEEAEMLQKEADYYGLSREEWKKKYKIDKPKDILEIY